MPWGLMDDKFHRNRKVRAVRREGARGREALGVWVYWWSWCLDDPEQSGIVPREEMTAADLKAAEILEECGLWESVDSGWLIHDFHDYLNGNKRLRDEKREAKREADRVRVAAQRAASRENVANVARDICDIHATVAGDGRDSSHDVACGVAHVSRPPRARAGPLPSPPPPYPTPTDAPLMVDESLRFPEPGAENFNERDLERAVSEVRGGPPWTVPIAPFHRQQSRATAAAIMAYAALHGYDPHAMARAAFDGWLTSQKSKDPMVWCANWAVALPPPPKPREPYRDLEG